MKRFFIYALFFVLPLLVAAVILEYLIRQVPNPYKYKYEWMQKNAENVEIIVLGSSHTFYGIRPDYFRGKAFNLANVSQGLRQDLFVFKYWVDRYKNLKAIIYPISFGSWFGQGLEYGSESYRCRYYKIYMDCNLYPDISWYNLELSDYRTAKKKITRLYSSETELGYDAFGWGTTYKLSKKDMKRWNDDSEAEEAVKRHTAKSWDYIDRNYALMRELAYLCKRQNIQLVLITTPCWHTYFDNLGKKQLTKMYELTYKFKQEYNLQYYDYLKDPRFEADDFYDSNHLSDVGAIKFTRILDEDMKMKPHLFENSRND